MEENTGRTLFDIKCSKIFFEQSPGAMNIKTKINKWDLIKLKNICTAKETINNIRQYSEWGKIFANKITDKRLTAITYKQLIQFSVRKTKSPIKKMDGKPKQTFLQRRHTINT